MPTGKGTGRGRKKGQTYKRRTAKELDLDVPAGTFSRADSAAWLKRKRTREAEEALTEKRRKLAENRKSAEEISQEMAASRSLVDPSRLRQVTLFEMLGPSTAATSATSRGGAGGHTQQQLAGMARVDRVNSACPFCECHVEGYGRRRSHLVPALSGRKFFGCAKYTSRGVRGVDYCNFTKTATQQEVDAINATKKAEKEAKARAKANKENQRVVIVVD
mmetsp:Transcript_19139/g.61597  ORF Transcript_19139/g.61597 Transcript_19139/m.61597 type:complete len:219 (-) Transcript_19139:1271-1927(-)